MKREKRIKVRLNEKEKALLDRKVEQSGLSREAYMRQLLEKTNIPTKLQPAYQAFAEQLHQIGDELNYVARNLHVLGVIDVQKYDEVCSEFQQVVNKIMEAVR